MEIKVTSYSYNFLERDNKCFSMVVKTDNASVEEELCEKDAHELAVSLLGDTVLDNCWHSEVVGKLIEAGVITHEQILEYVAESGEE